MCYPCKAAHIVIEKHNSGPKGCKALLESHCDDGHHDLICIDSGYSTFRFQEDTVIHSTNPAGATFNINQYIIPLVEHQISSGNSDTGEFYLTPDIVVRWHGTDINNYSLRITGNFKVAE